VSYCPPGSRSASKIPLARLYSICARTLRGTATEEMPTQCDHSKKCRRRAFGEHGRAGRIQEHLDFGPPGIARKLVNHVGADDGAAVKADDA